MVQEDLRDIYFEWMYSLVCGREKYSRLSYKKLLWFLYNTEFTWIIELDCNRAVDGVDFKYRFGYENKYPRHTIERYLDNGECSVLEMMVALAFKMEEQIMDDSEYGDRTGQWFWNMIVNLGLGNMHDNNFNESYSHRIISKFLDRDYRPNGKGGLFVIDNCKYDLRDVEIWYQAMWYLDDVIDSQSL